MLSPELLAGIRKLYFQTRRLAHEGLSGSYKSLYKGQGIEFEEVREYFPGDDVRAIDWKVTARSRKPYIRSYREEREINVVLVVDVSPSTRTGVRAELRSTLVGQIGALLATVAIQNNDRVGLLTFGDGKTSFTPPRKARSSAWAVLHKVLAPAADRSGLKTTLPQALQFLAKSLKKTAVIFIISDFQDADCEKELSRLSRRHDVNAFLIRERSDEILPQMGLLRVVNPESGENILVDTTNKKVREYYSNEFLRWHEGIIKLFKKNRVKFQEVYTDESPADGVRKLLAC
jgi:uncharacterized protein (DUF58 family)